MLISKWFYPFIFHCSLALGPDEHCSVDCKPPLPYLGKIALRKAFLIGGILSFDVFIDAQLELEKEEKEAASREKRLVERALEAEQGRADALRTEAAASAEALEAERAAKFAADAEATVLQRNLDDLNAALQQERYVCP